MWCGGGAFLESGLEYEYWGEMYQNTGTMDYAPSAAALAWKSKVRMQVEGDDIHVELSDLTASQYVGPWDTRAWAWDQTVFTRLPTMTEIFTISYSEGRAVSMKVPRSFDLHRRNMARAFATTWQLSLGGESYFTSTEVLQHHHNPR